MSLVNPMSTYDIDWGTDEEGEERGRRQVSREDEEEKDFEDLDEDEE